MNKYIVVRLFCCVIIAFFSINKSYAYLSDSIYSYLDVDKLPKFITKDHQSVLGYIYSEIKYPDDLDIQGSVIVSFIINKEGCVDEVSIKKHLCDRCDTEVKRVFYSMPKWLPGKKNGKKVDTQLILEIDFCIY